MPLLSEMSEMQWRNSSITSWTTQTAIEIPSFQTKQYISHGIPWIIYQIFISEFAFICWSGWGSIYDLNLKRAGSLPLYHNRLRKMKSRFSEWDNTLTRTYCSLLWGKNFRHCVLKGSKAESNLIYNIFREHGGIK